MTTASSRITLQDQALAKLFQQDGASIQTGVINSIYTISDAALTEGVRSVGFGLDDNDNSSNENYNKTNNEAIFRILHKVYDKNLDKMSLYCMRNVFSLDKHVCRRIIAGCEAKNTIHDNYDDQDDDERNVEIDKANENECIPTEEEVDAHDVTVTQEDVINVDEELKILRSELIQDKRRLEVVRNHLSTVKNVEAQCFSSAKNLKDALKSGADTSNSDNDYSKDKVHELVSGVMMGKDILTKVREDGIELLKKLSNIKSNGMNVDSIENVQQRNRPLCEINLNSSLEEGYTMLRKKLRTNRVTDVKILVNKLNGK